MKKPTIQEEIKEGLLNVINNNLDTDISGEAIDEKGVDSVLVYLHSKGVVILGKTDYADETLKLYSYEPLIKI